MINKETITHQYFSPQKEADLTVKGLAKLVDELGSFCHSKRKELSQQQQNTKGKAEDGEYMIALEEPAYIEDRIPDLEKLLLNYRVIEPGCFCDNVQLSSKGVIREEDQGIETYNIEGNAEANPGYGFTSNQSPLGTALLEDKVRDDIEVNANGGKLKFRVVTVQ